MLYMVLLDSEVCLIEKWGASVNNDDWWQKHEPHGPVSSFEGRRPIMGFPLRRNSRHLVVSCPAVPPYRPILLVPPYTPTRRRRCMKLQPFGGCCIACRLSISANVAHSASKAAAPDPPLDLYNRTSGSFRYRNETDMPWAGRHGVGPHARESRSPAHMIDLQAALKRTPRASLAGVVILASLLNSGSGLAVVVDATSTSKGRQLMVDGPNKQFLHAGVRTHPAWLCIVAVLTSFQPLYCKQPM